MLLLRRTKYLLHAGNEPSWTDFAVNDCWCGCGQRAELEAWTEAIVGAIQSLKMGPSSRKWAVVARWDCGCNAAGLIETMIETLYRRLCHSRLDSG